MNDAPVRHHSRGALVFSCLAVFSGCGGGTPLLHPAHVLAPGKFSAGAGMSRNFLLGKEASALETANETAIQNGPDAERKLARGMMVDALRSPGIAPWVSVRAGIIENTEAGVTYSGRLMRVDGRHAFELGDLSLSVGGGLRLRPFEADRQNTILGANTDSVTGFGFDVPVLIGWQSDASLVQVWGGVRAGYDRVSGPLEVNLASVQTDPTNAPELEGEQLFGEMIFGLAVGLSPIWVAAELGVGYGRGTGSVRYRPGASPEDVEVSGLVLTPAGALVGKF